MYYNYSDFKSQNWRGMIYLFSASLGNFDFSLFSQNEEYLPRQYGWIYLILFLVLTNIVLINFLIAILSNKYTEMEPKKKLLYNRNILRIKQIQAEDKILFLFNILLRSSKFYDASICTLYCYF